jgi:succinyl-CoA synthetase beta subunit
LLARVGIATPGPAPRGGPAFVKTGNLEIAHKHEAGAVLGPLHDVAGAVALIRRRLGPRAEPVLVQAVVEHEHELLAAVQTAVCARYVVLGAGGGEAERLRDVAFCLLPAAPEELRAALASTAVGRELDPAELELACDAVGGLVRLHAALGCSELEVNPLIVAGGRPVALDFVVGYEKGQTG